MRRNGPGHQLLFGWRQQLPYTPLGSLRGLNGRSRGAAHLLAAGITVPVIAAGANTRDQALAAVEAVLLVAEEPLTARRLAVAASLTDAAEARRQVRRLQAQYEQDGTAFQVVELAGGYQLLTRAEFHPWVNRWHTGAGEIKLTPAALETLTIVAYRQPIMRAEVESIRGVQSGEMLRFLMEKGLLRIAGRHNSLGRPVLYGTTRKFLQVFGLKSLEDLPPGDQLRQPQPGPASDE